METNGRKYYFLGILVCCLFFGETADAGTSATHSQQQYPKVNDYVAKVTRQISPVSYVAKNGLVHLRMRPIFAFLPSVKNMGYSVLGHMQRVGHSFHQAMLGGFPLPALKIGGGGGGAYDNSVGSNNVSPIKSAWSRIKCFPFGSKCHQQQDNSNYNDNYVNNNNNNDNNYYKNFNQNNDNFNNYNNNYHYI